MPAELATDGFGWVLYDGDCPRCTAMARRFEAAWRRRGYSIAPLQSPWVAARFGLDAGELLTAMRVITPDGRVLTGAEAVVHLARLSPWLRPLLWMADYWPVSPMLAVGYAWVARRRPTCRCHDRGKTSVQGNCATSRAK